jgi:hypothetical protein
VRLARCTTARPSIERKASKPGNFRDLDRLAERVQGFQHSNNTTPTPFDWNYTREDLDTLLTRLDEHDTTRPA